MGKFRVQVAGLDVVWTELCLRFRFNLVLYSFCLSFGLGFRDDSGLVCCTVYC